MLKQQWHTKLRVLGYGVVLCISPALYAATFPTEAMFEAERDAPGIPWKTQVSGTDVVSGGKYVITPANLPRVDAPSSAVELSYTIAVPRAGSYTIWLRVLAPSSAADSFYLAVDNAAYAAAFPPFQSGPKPAWVWFPVTQWLAAGERELKLKYREAGMGIDCLLVTALADFVPQGYGAYPLPTVLPPVAEHPRLFARDGDLDDIRSRLESYEPEIKPYRDTLLSFRNALPVVALPPLPVSVGNAVTTNHQIDVLTKIKAKALSYLLYEKDGPPAQAVRGWEAVGMMVDYLGAVQFSSGYNLANEKGEVILTSAIVYDWCYSLMSAQQRSYFVKRFTEIAATMEIGFPPSRQGAVVGHGSEMQLLRDQLAAGIAFYDEAPLIYNTVAGRFFADYIAPRNYAYASHAHHQGASYGPVRYMADMFAAWIFKRMGAGPVFDQAQQMTPYHWLYARRPDGQWMRDGDTYQSSYTKSTQYWSEPLAFLLPATYYNNPLFKHEYLMQPATSITSKDSLWPILFGNTEMDHGAGYSSLPLTKYFADPAGLMIARTGWTDGMHVDSGNVIATMKLGGDWFANHEHYDAGHFQIYYKGGLAIDSGIYSGRNADDPTKTVAYNSPHDMNYHKRSIAHNSMLIHDPQEVFGNFVNDGGQRMPGAEPQSLAALSNGYKVASVLKHQFGPDSQIPDYSYIKGDLKPAYSDKVREFERSFVFLNLKDADHPAALIVFDKVRARDAGHKKTWLLHSQSEPEIANDTVVIKRTESDYYHTYQYNGKLINRTLLPAHATIVKVGGSGNEFSVAGKNYPILPMYDFSTEEAGAWRVEVSPQDSNETDLFLNVMQVMDARSLVPALDTTAINSDVFTGVRIKDRVVLFAKNGMELDGAASFELPVLAAPVRVLVSDLRAGFWLVNKRGATATVEHEVDAAAGTLYFVATEAGQYDLRRANVRTLPAPAALETLPTQP